MAIIVAGAAEILISDRAVQASANNRDVFAATCAGVMAAITLTTAPASMADIRLPPLDNGERNASFMLALAMTQHGPHALAPSVLHMVYAVVTATCSLPILVFDTSTLIKHSCLICRPQPLREGLCWQHHRPGVCRSMHAMQCNTDTIYMPCRAQHEAPWRPC